MLFSKPWLASQEMHCGNNCEPVASRMSRSCVCRKRKEHEEDFYEADWKFSKSSDRSGGDGNSMILLMKKWSNNEVVKGEEGPVVQQDSDYKEPHQPSSPATCGKVSDNNNQQKGRFTIIESDCSMSLSEKHRDRLPVKTWVRSKSKSRQLSRKLSVLQSKIESESEEFQKSLGYRPSLADKMKCEEISDLLLEKTKIKLELKDLNEESPRKKVAGRSVEQAMDNILTSLHSLRTRAGRPYSLDQMTGEEMVEERQDMHSLLTEFEKLYSNNYSKKEKDVMCELYERLRSVKRLCRRQSSDLVAIPEEHSLDLTLASTRARKSSQGEEEDNRYKPSPADLSSSSPELTAEEEKWHEMSMTDLNSTLKKLKESKKYFKRNISEIEIRAKSEEEELSTTDVYVEYKATKCKIKLIKALLEKHNI